MLRTWIGYCLIFVLLTAVTGSGFAASEPLDFSWYVNYDWYTAPNWPSDSVGEEWIRDNKNVQIEWISPQGAAQHRLSLMMVNDEYPDVLVLERGEQVERLVQAGKLVPLDDWIENSNLRYWAGDATLNMLRSSDGKLYQFPNWYIAEGRSNGNSGWIINTEIYEALGEPPLATTEDLYAYLQLVKQEYPNVIPLESLEDFQAGNIIYSAFGEERNSLFLSNMVFPDNGELRSIFDDPAFLDAVVFTNKLFGEGLITQDGFTQTRDQAREKIATQRFAVYAGNDAIAPARQAVNQSGQDKAFYQAIWPIHKPGLDPDRITPSQYNTLGWNVNVISVDAADPQRIFDYLDWLTGAEGQRTIRFGPIGHHYDEVDEQGYPIFNDLFHETPVSERRWGGANYVGNTVWADTAGVWFEMQQPEEDREWGLENQYSVTWNTSLNTTSFSNIRPLPNTAEGQIFQRVQDIYELAYAQMVFADSAAEVESILDRARSDADRAGFERVVTYMNEKYQENLELMGR